MKKSTNTALTDLLSESEQEWITFGVTDMDGVFRAKTISKEKVIKSLDEGVGFCNVIFGWDVNDACYDNTTLVGWHTGYPDVTARIDPETKRSQPWDKERPLFIADLRDSSLEGICPRSLLRKVTKQASDSGFEAKGASELEWFNFAVTEGSPYNSHGEPVPITTGMFGYSLLRMGQNNHYVRALLEQLQTFDILLEGIHTETGDGVYEAALAYTDLNEAADRAALFKTAVKLIAHEHGIMPSFMAKWNPRLPGCSQHIHLSLWKRDQNLFYHQDDPGQMTETMRQFTAGILHCLPHILPMYAPVTNSYKRFVEGSWAPTTVSWGVENRTTAIRIIPGSSSSCRIENRVPGSDANPYLAMAATLASGLYGIRNELNLTEPVTGNAYDVADLQPLHSTLDQATKAMKHSPLAAELFGDDFARHFVETREWEVHQQQTGDPKWERKRYFEVI